MQRSTYVLEESVRMDRPDSRGSGRSYTSSASAISVIGLQSDDPGDSSADEVFSPVQTRRNVNAVRIRFGTFIDMPFSSPCDLLKQLLHCGGITHLGDY